MLLLLYFYINIIYDGIDASGTIQINGGTINILAGGMGGIGGMACRP